jgi:tetratricopeptide (TPR) repeat protein
MTRIRFRRFAALAALGLLCADGRAMAQETEPLQKSDVVRLLVTSGDRQGAVAATIRARCLTFVPNARDLDDFNRLGASQEVLGAIRGCASPPAGRSELRVASQVVTATVGGTARIGATVIRDGRPAAGVRVVLRGGGELPGGGGRDPEAASGQDGTVAFSVSAGTRPGSYPVTLVAVGADDIANRDVRLNVVPGPAATATGIPAGAAAEDGLEFEAVLRDRFDNPVVGAAVLARAGEAATGAVLFRGETDGRGVVRVAIAASRLEGVDRVLVEGPAGTLGSIGVESGPAAVGRFVVVSGMDQVTEAGEPFPLPVVVEARDATGLPVAGAEVRHSVENGSVLEADGTTDARGRAAARVRAGSRGWSTLLRVESGEASETVALEISREGLTEDDLSGLLARADSLLAAGAPAAARPLYERASAVDPARVQGRLGLAATSAALGRLDEAEQTYRGILRDASGNREAALGLATVLDARGRPADAATWYQLALSRSPDDVETWVALGNARLAAGDTDLARDAFERALALKPDNASARAGLSRARRGEPMVRGEVWGGNTNEDSRSFGPRHAEVRVAPADWLALRGTFDDMLGLRHPWQVRGFNAIKGWYGAATARWGPGRRLETTFEAGRRTFPDRDGLYQTSWLVEQGVRLSPTASIRAGGWLGRWYDRDDKAVFGEALLDVAPGLSLRPSVSWSDAVGSDISGGEGEPGTGRDAETEIRLGLGLRYEAPAGWSVEPAVAWGSVSADDAAFEGGLLDATARVRVPIGRVLAVQGFVRYQSPPGTPSFVSYALGLGLAGP